MRMLAPLLIVALVLGYFFRDGLLPGFDRVPGHSQHATLTGRVVNGSTDQPVGGAIVRAGALSVAADAAGMFELTHSDAMRRRLELTVEKPGFHPRRIGVEVDRARIDLGRIPLTREYYLTGRVVSRDMGAPVPAATVALKRAREDGGNLIVRADHEGKYRVGPVLEGRPFDLLLEHPAYLPAELEDRVILNAADNVPVAVSLAVGGVISGEARTSRGERIPGVRVVVHRGGPDGSAGPVEKSGWSDPDGTFLIQGLFPGSKIVVGESPDGERRTAPVTVTVRKAGEVQGVRLVFLSR
jgi:hypothetical protein